MEKFIIWDPTDQEPIGEFDNLEDAKNEVRKIINEDIEPMDFDRYSKYKVASLKIYSLVDDKIEKPKFKNYFGAWVSKDHKEIDLLKGFETQEEARDFCHVCILEEKAWGNQPSDNYLFATVYIDENNNKKVLEEVR